MTTILTGTASARAAAIAERCAQAAWHGTAWQACCPSHYDTQVLLSITSNTDAVLLSCCAGCQPAQIVARLGLTLDDLCVHQPSANGTTPPLPDLETLDALDMEDEAEEGLEPRAWEELTLAEQQALMLDVFTPAEWLTNRGLVVGMLLRRDDRQWYPWKAQAKARGVDAYGYEKTVDKMLADFAGPKTKHTRSRTAQEAEDTAQTEQTGPNLEVMMTPRGQSTGQVDPSWQAWRYDYYQAVAVDGGSAWHRFRYVTLPLSWPATNSVIILSFIGGLRSFDLIWTMTRGGPGFTSDVIASIIYKQYQAGFFGLSTAGNVILFIVVTALVVPLTRFLSAREVAA